MPKKFIRRDSVRYSKIGKGRRKLQKWRKPKGRDNKMRLKRKSYPKTVSIGYGKPKKKNPQVLIRNLNDLVSADKNSEIIISKRIGAKKKIDIILGFFTLEE